MLEMDRFLQPIRRATFGFVALSLIVMGPWLGWWTVLPVFLAAIAFRIADLRIGRLERPEYALFAAWCASEVIIATAVAFTGGPTVSTMSWLAIPIATLATRFSGRGVTAGVALAIALVLAVGFGVNAQAVINDPPLVIAPITLIVAMSMFLTALRTSDIKYRVEATIDPLTGMLNRKALDLRALELAEQSELTGLPVGVIVGDIDYFKQINDSAGHAAGDAVLKDVAYELRTTLRAFDLFYRLGGEEFMVLLPGADVDRAAALAEELRAGVAAAPRGGHPVTMSFGASASMAGERFDYETIFAAADAALYEAKRAGRNVVRSSAGPDAPEPGVVAPVSTETQAL